MRKESEVKVEVRGKIIGGESVLICLPLLGSDRAEILLQVEKLAALTPDLIEWRVDDFSEAASCDACINLLQDIRAIVGEIPLIFTHRIATEGGLQTLSQETRLEVIGAVIESGEIDLVDVELCNEEGFLNEVSRKAQGCSVKVILSHHNFERTPDEEFIRGKLLEAQQAGADIAKVAVMPTQSGDVLTLLQATNQARNGDVQIPMITISMAQDGVVSRIAGGLFGSDITFAAGTKSSAPGQIGFEELKTTMRMLF